LLYDFPNECGCTALLNHHIAILAAIEEESTSLIAAATAHCTAFSSLEEEPVPGTTTLSLQVYHLDPSFLWVPREDRAALFGWARSAFVIKFASNTQPFVDLPDDCAGDVMEFIDLKMTRKECMHIYTKCSSPEAHASVGKVVAAELTVNSSMMESDVGKS